MCGIVGYVGEEQAAPILLEGLSKLEYRGYDSAGIAVRNETSGDISVVKAKGRLNILAEKTDNGRSVLGTWISLLFWYITVLSRITRSSKTNWSNPDIHFIHRQIQRLP